MAERDFWVAFSTFPFIGPKRFKLLVEYFGSSKGAWEAPLGEIREIGMSEKLAVSFEKHRKGFDLGGYLGRLEKLGIGVVTFNDAEYPERLKAIDDAPFLLYVKMAPLRSAESSAGQLPRMSLCDTSNLAVAVVGTRRITSYGRDVCERITRGLVDAGVTIVSGLALGTDAVSHKAALDAGGNTIAVLGNGLDTVYPASNRALAEKMLSSGQGILVSEYPLGYPARPENFPVRNRIVSGMSLAVVVIEGTRKSGTLLTASLAAKQGRDVFAVPGQITSPMSQAPHLLIKNGAKLVENVEDILEELDIKAMGIRQEAIGILPNTEEEGKLLELLETEGLELDSIVRISDLQAGVVLATLTNMEMKGLVKNVGGVYVKK